jgi:ribose transport system ATP-binding protein
LRTLSGGNQQKVVMARWLRIDPQVLLLDEPTQGVDVGAKAELHRQVLAASAHGTAVVVSSTDVEELVTLSDRVLIMRAGRVAEELTGERVTENAINHSFHQHTSTQKAE